MIRKWVLVLLTMGLMVATAFAQSKGSISIAGEKWAPYNNYVLDKTKPGFMFEIVEAVLKKNGYSFTYKETPWARAVVDAQTGAADALMTADKLTAVGFTFPDEPMGFSVTKFYTKKDSAWEFKGLGSLATKKVGILNGVSYGDAFDKYVTANPSSFDVISGSDAVQRSFQKLDAGRIDAYLEDSAVAGYFFQQNKQMGTYKESGTLEGGVEMFLAFSPKFAKGKEIAALMTDGVRQMRKSGELKTILDKYGVKDWK